MMMVSKGVKAKRGRVIAFLHLTWIQTNGSNLKLAPANFQRHAGTTVVPDLITNLWCSVVFKTTQKDLTMCGY